MRNPFVTPEAIAQRIIDRAEKLAPADRARSFDIIERIIVVRLSARKPPTA
jgi:hypothetical protein